MMNAETDLKIWEEHLKKVFPFSDALQKEDLYFTEEYGQSVLSVKGERFLARFVDHITDGTLFIRPQDHYPPIYLTQKDLVKKSGMDAGNQSALY